LFVVYHERPRDGSYVFAYLHNEDAPEMANAALHTNLNILPSVSTKFASSSINKESRVQDESYPLFLSHTQARQDILSSTLLGAKYELNNDLKLLGDNNVPHYSIEFKQHAGIPDYRLQPGSFRILLCVDNQEYFARYVNGY